MPETYAPIVWHNDQSPALNETNLNRIEVGVEVLDDRIATLENGIVTPVVVPFATSVTLNATQGSLFRCVASADMTLDQIVGGTDGQTIVFEVQASGAGRTLHFTGSTATVDIATGQWWVGVFRYLAAPYNTWLRADDAAASGGGNDLNVLAPQNLSYAATITPDASTGALFRVTAPGDFTLNAPVNGTDGQAIVLEVLATGGARTVSFAAGYPAITIQSGSRWTSTLRYNSTTNDWLLATASNTASAVASINGFTGAVSLTADNVPDGSTKVTMTAAERTKLAGVATGATAYTAESARDDLAAALVPGSNITITPNDAGDIITISASAGSGYATVQDEGTARTARATLNFVGTGVTVTDDSANSRTLVTIPGAASGLGAVLVANAPSGDTTGATDQAHLQSLLTSAISTNGTVYLRNGIYYVTGLVGGQSFGQANFRGVGQYQTTLRVVGTGTALRYTGGSGALSGAEISDMTVDSTAGTGIGIELRDCGGVFLKRIRFQTLATGLIFHNFAAASFTEGCVARECWFAYVTRAIRYQVTSGDQSFHGSGFQNCWFNQPSSATSPVITIDAISRVYNAPFDGLFFLDPSSTGQPVVSCASTEEMSTFGNIRTEGTANFTFVNFTGGGAGVMWYHDGGIHNLGNTVTMGSRFRQVFRRQENSDGSITAQLVPYNKTGSITTGSNALLSLDGGESYLVAIDISGANYHYNNLLYVFGSPYDNNGTVVSLGTGISVNVAGYGAPTYAVNSSTRNLQVTNAGYPASGLGYRAYITPLLQRLNFPIG